MKYLTKKKALRHGDILVIPIDSMPKLKEKGKIVIHGGSHGNPHSIVNGLFFPQRSEPNILGYLEVSENGHLTHKEHGEVSESGLKKAPIDAGYYEVRVQVEDSHDEMKEVID